jgi:hypothetical protein
LTPADLDVDDFPADHTLYGFAGFPVTKNRVYLTTLKPSSMACVVVASPPDAYARLKLHPATHFLGNFDRNKQVDSVKVGIPDDAERRSGMQPNAIPG